MDKPPPLDARNGFIYPLVWRVLQNPFWPPTKFVVRRNDRRLVDVLIVGCWSIEAVLWLLVGLCGASGKFWLWSLLILFSFRIHDILWVLFSILVTGSWRGGKVACARRIVLLCMFNAVELMVLSAGLYYAIQCLFPHAGRMSEPLRGLWESLSFSVVTATTLGYGTPYPKGWAVQLVSMLESASMLLVVVVFIGYFANAEKPGIEGD